MTSAPEARGLRPGGSVRDFRLTSWQRRRLRAALRTAKDVGVLRRVGALLELDRGTRLVEVAAHLGVTRQTVHNWILRFRAGGGLGALHDRARRGRTPKLSPSVRGLLVWLLEQPPDAFGYAAVSWTASLLREVLAAWVGVDVSEDTIRRALHGLGHAWKRPRHILLPDPDREKKTPDSPADRTTSSA